MWYKNKMSKDEIEKNKLNLIQLKEWDQMW